MRSKIVFTITACILFVSACTQPLPTQQDAQPKQQYVSIFEPWAAREDYVWVGPDGISYRIERPRSDGCYLLYPPTNGEINGLAVRFADTCQGNN